MVVILAAGIISLSQIKLEVFPEFSSDIITVSVPYLGAPPEEVEEGVCVRIEEAILDLEGIKKISSTASEGVGSVTVEVQPGYDTRKLLDDVKSRVDGISTFPEETEKPIIQELVVRSQVINVAISGQTDEKSLKAIAERVRDEITDLPEVSQVELSAARPYEISIEVSEDVLRRYGLTFDEVAQAVRRSSLDLPGGTVKTSSGEISLRTKGQAYKGGEFEKLILRSFEDGTRLRLGDVATVIDGFAETDQTARFNGDPAMLVQVFRVGDENALDLANAVKEYVADAGTHIPEGIHLTTWQDDSLILKDRLSLLLRNGRAGFVLVFLALALFLRFRLAWWVSVGMAISFFGAFWMMPNFDISINLLSLFAFILVLGIVVDDAIVIGENIYSHLERGKKGLQAAIQGTQEVAVPVTFAVLTTIAAFSPLLSITGNMGKFLKVIPIIVISTLVFSLIESLLILPAHLSHLKFKRDKNKAEKNKWFKNLQAKFAERMDHFVKNYYRKILDLALKWRYTSIAIGVGSIVLTMAIVGSGWLKFVFFPDFEADNVVAFVSMPEGK
ncbi:MAG: efflux RND transporter permease subunit, partial [Nitrospinaceae bacterium]